MNDLQRLNLMMPGGGTPQDAVTEALGTVVLKNLIKNGSFENDLNNWSGGTIDTTYKKFGTKSVKLVSSNGSAVIVGQIQSVINGHKYYGCVWAMRTASVTGNGNLDISGVSPEVDFVMALDNTNIPTVNTWYLLSNVVQAQVSGTGQFRCHTTSLNPLYFDGYMLIDLTEIFGAGKEPTTEQMDEIMMALGGWFDGSAILQSIPKGSYRKVGVSGYPEISVAETDYDALKTEIANSITDMGVSASGSDTFSALATKIGQIATLKFVVTSGSASAGGVLQISGLDFTPMALCAYTSYNYDDIRILPTSFNPNGVSNHLYASVDRDQARYLSTSHSFGTITITGTDIANRWFETIHIIGY